MADELPAGTAPVVLNGKDHAAENAEFKAMVQKSKENMAQLNAPPKRGRGRPPKVASSSEAREPHTTAHGPAPSVAPRAPALDISKYLIAPIMMASKIPAGRIGIPEIALTADEAGLCAMSLNELLNVFVPDIGQMSPKTAAVISAFSTFGAIGFSKYQIYLAKTQELRVKAAAENQENSENPPAAAAPFQTIHAIEHFGRQ